MLDNLSQVNVFAGANNCGKTSVLEAIRLLRNPSDVGQLVWISTVRAGASAETKKENLINYLLSIFQRDDDDEKTPFYHLKVGAEVHGEYHLYEADGNLVDLTDSSGEERQMLALSVKDSDGQGGKPSYQTAEIINGEDKTFVASQKSLFGTTYLLSSLNYYRVAVEVLSDYIIREGKGEVLSVLRTFDPNIDDISIVGKDIYLHNTATGSLPLFAYGSGMQKAVLLTVIIAFRRDGVILIDEIDNAIHVSAFEDVFRWLLDACLTYNVQAFITTHSAEALDAILRVNHERHAEDDLLRIITLRKNYSSQATSKRVRTGEEAYRDREQFGLELRV